MTWTVRQNAIVSSRRIERTHQPFYLTLLLNAIREDPIPETDLVEDTSTRITILAEHLDNCGFELKIELKVEPH